MCGGGRRCGEVGWMMDLEIFGMELGPPCDVMDRPLDVLLHDCILFWNCFIARQMFWLNGKIDVDA